MEWGPEAISGEIGVVVLYNEPYQDESHDTTVFKILLQVHVALEHVSFIP